MISATRIRKRIAKLEERAPQERWFDVNGVVQAAIAQLPPEDRDVFSSNSLYEVAVLHPEIWGLFEKTLPVAHLDANAPYVFSATQLLL